MSFISRTILTCRAIDDVTGMVIVEFAKQVFNGDALVSSESHLLSVPPVLNDGSSPDWAYISGQVDAHLDNLGFSAATQADWDKISAFHATMITPEVKAVYIASMTEAAKVSSPSSV